MDDENEEWLRVGVAAELSRRHAQDQREFVETLANLLSASLPELVEIRRGGFALRSNRPIQSVSITLEDHRYLLDIGAHGALRTRRVLTKRGITLSTEEIPVDQWIQQLCAAMEAFADRNHRSLQALKRMGS